MPRSRSIAGSATLTTVASRKTTVEARIVAIRVSRSLRVTPTSVSGGATAPRMRPRARASGEPSRLGLLAQLVGRREEVPVGERDRDQPGEGDAAEQGVEEDQLQADGVGGV